LPTAQTVPQTPQLSGSVCFDVQNFSPPLVVQASGVVAGQEQALPEHCWPIGQIIPQPPQLFASLTTFAQ
jgi:hypothetical protein